MKSSNKKATPELKSLSTLQIIVIALVSAALVFAAVRYFDAQQDKNRAKTSIQHQISLLADKANPDVLAIKTGEYVQFNSQDGKSHSLSLGSGTAAVAANEGGEHSHQGKFNSGEFAADEAWRVQFTKPGVYSFHDHLEPDINIRIVVYTPSVKDQSKSLR